MSLTAVEATRPVDFARVAIANSAANTGSVAPHHLREVAPCVVVVRVVVWVLGLLLVPAVGGGASELYPVFVLARSRLLRGEIAAGTHLWKSTTTIKVAKKHITYVLGHVGTLGDVAASSISKALVPD